MRYLIRKILKTVNKMRYLINKLTESYIVINARNRFLIIHHTFDINRHVEV